MLADNPDFEGIIRRMENGSRSDGGFKEKKEGKDRKKKGSKSESCVECKS